jgi:hypothetical protein
MLSASQRRRCAEIAAALDRDDLTLWRKAEPLMSPEERGAVWDSRQHVKAMAERHRKTAVMPGHDFAAVSNDLDYWPPELEGKPAPMPPQRIPPMPTSDDDEDSPSPPVLPDHPEEDDDTEQETKVCPTCMGKGTDHSGRTCATCGGTGRVPMDDVDDDDEEEAGSFYGIEDED